jgi:hypothetical protein
MLCFRFASCRDEHFHWRHATPIRRRLVEVRTVFLIPTDIN